jgi:hypothetical protein
MIGHMADRYMLIGSLYAIICTKLEASVVLKKKLLVDLAIQVESYYKRKLRLWKLVIDGSFSAFYSFTYEPKITSLTGTITCYRSTTRDDDDIPASISLHWLSEDDDGAVALFSTRCRRRS